MRLIFAGLMGLAWWLGSGSGGAAPPPPEAAAAVAASRDAQFPEIALSPMMAEIKAVLANARLVEAELELALGQAETPAAADQIRAELAAHQWIRKIQILEIQARHVRAEGREELARLIEARLESLRDNRPPIARAAATD